MAKLVNQLAQHALETHPNQVTTVLERIPQEDAVRFLGAARLENAAKIVECLSPNVAPAVLHAMKTDRAAHVIETLAVDSSARVLRRMDEDRQQAILSLVDPKRARSIRSVLRFREGSAGALMDPDVLALPSDLSAREALARIRKVPELARYNLYVVGDTQKLVGALNLRELLLGRGRLPLSDLMTRDPHRILATADRASVLAHRGWREVHSLPVVDTTDAFLGAIRYRVLRRLEEDLVIHRGEDAEAGAAFGQLIAAGARGLIDAVSGAAGFEQGRSPRGPNERS